MNRNASLLPVGIVKVKGEFSQGVVVSLEDEAGNELGRGRSRVSSKDAEEYLAKKKSNAVASGKHEEWVHRDEMLLY